LTGAVVLPALEALEYPVMDFSVAALGALAAQCPALRALDLRSAGSASVDMQREDYLTFDDARARSLAAFPTLEWLAVGTVAPTDAGWAAWAEAIGPDGYFVRGPNGVTLPGLTAAGVAALLDRPSAKPWRRLCVIFGNVPGCFGGAEAGFAGATGGLPTALELVGHLPVAAAVALAGLPAPVAASLTSLTVSINDGRVWRALSPLPVRSLTVVIWAYSAVWEFGGATFPHLTTLTLVRGSCGQARGVAFDALAAAAPALTALTLADTSSWNGFGEDCVARALAALPRLRSLAFRPAWPVAHEQPVGFFERAGAAVARRLSTSRTAVRVIIRGVPVDPWAVPV